MRVLFSKSLRFSGLFAVLTLSSLGAQPRLVELEDIYGPDAISFSGELPSIEWSSSSTHFLESRGSGNSLAWHRVDALSGESVLLFDPEGLAKRIVDSTGIDEAVATDLARPGKLRLSPDEESMLQVPAEDGFLMEAFLLEPADFDPAKRYPVFVYGYGGPHAQSVRNAWGGARYLWYQYLAQRGFIVWVCDNRIASGKGAQSTWKVFKNFGEQELSDLEDSLDWLQRRDYVDATRIGLSGWSFGGFMTTYAMTRSDRFRIGIAGGTVTDWRDYDTIYTERYMATPEENPEGYRRASVRERASELKGRLMLIHGTMDDNVHMQNTLQFAYDLQKAGKPFDLMLYPRSRHGIQDPDQVLHMRRMIADFVFQHLMRRGADRDSDTDRIQP